MRQFQDKKKIRNKLYSKIVIIGLVIVVVLLSKAIIKIYLKELESRKLLENTEQKFNDISKREISLSQQINNLNTPEGVEEEIRSKLNVVKPGEQIMLLVPEEKIDEPSPKPSFFGGVWLKMKTIFKD